MNGRAYDYNLGRFLSVDPIIQAPGNSQSLNPYSYIMNNPLAGTDPTGYCAAEIGSRIKSCGDMKVDLKIDGKEVGSTVVKDVNFKNGAEVNAAKAGGAGQIGRAIMDINSQQNNALGQGGSSINQNGVGLFEGVGQRFGNLVTRGQFMTDEQTDVYDAAAKMAYLSGGNEGLMDFFRENPLFTGTKGVAEMLAGVGAIRLVSVSTRGATVAISGEAAEAYMISQGVPAHLAPEFVASFQGQIKARIVQKGESFIRYSSQAGGQGSFVTQKVYSSPGAAVDALYLKPFGNTATYMQRVTAQRNSIVFEGGIYNGASGARQSFLVDQGAFTFGSGVRY
jgi:hypothetical protein